jgi:hypothetical protein
VNAGRNPKEGNVYGDGSFRYLGEAFTIKVGGMLSVIVRD